MKRMLALASVLCVALFLGGCLDLMQNSTSKGTFSENGQYITVTEENGAGWVEIAMSSGGTIHWGDSFEEAAYTAVKGPGTYGHYYDEAGVYGIRLMSHEQVLDTAVVAIPHVAGHLELVQMQGSTAVVHWYGPADRNDTAGTTTAYQWIVWGDSNITTVQHSYNDEASHTYQRAGTYEIGIRGDVNGGDKYRACFTVTVP